MSSKALGIPARYTKGRPAVRELRGATVFVQAEPGLTPEWLQLTLSRRVAEMQRAGNIKGCAFGVNDIQVKVTSTGIDFGVYLIARDPRKAQEVLRLARLLVAGETGRQPDSRRALSGAWLREALHPVRVPRATR